MHGFAFQSSDYSLIIKHSTTSVISSKMYVCGNPVCMKLSIKETHVIECMFRRNPTQEECKQTSITIYCVSVDGLHSTWKLLDISFDFKYC